MTLEDSFRYNFLERRVAQGVYVGRVRYRLCRIVPAWGGPEGERAVYPAARVVLRMANNPRGREWTTIGESLPDGTVWIDWRQLRGFLTRRKRNVLDNVMRELYVIVRHMGPEIIIYKRKPCYIDLPGASPSAIPRNFNDRLAEKFGVL